MVATHQNRRVAVRRERRQQTSALELSVVIVNYAQWASTAALARQILQTEAARLGTVEVVVVDNHSPPDPLAARIRRWPGVSLRRWGRNRGFARAVNEGCRLSRGEWFLLLNPDIVLSAGALDEMLSSATQIRQTDPRAGIIGFHLRNSDGTRQGSAGPLPTLLGVLTGLFRPRSRRRYFGRRLRQRTRVPWITGCCLLVHRDCFQDAGGFDEDYFLYYEDVDLCQRARARGWSVWFEPRPRVIHEHPLEQRTVSPGLRLATRHALLTYASKHWSRWQFRLLAGIVRVEAMVRRLGAVCRGDRYRAQAFAELGRIARDVHRMGPRKAQRRLAAWLVPDQATQVPARPASPPG